VFNYIAYFAVLVVLFTIVQGQCWGNDQGSICLALSMKKQVWFRHLVEVMVQQNENWLPCRHLAA